MLYPAYSLSMCMVAILVLLVYVSSPILSLVIYFPSSFAVHIFSHSNSPINVSIFLSLPDVSWSSGSEIV